MSTNAIIKNVYPDSIASDCGIEKGDAILSVNSYKFKDILDFKYLTSDKYYVIEVLKKSGDIEQIEVFNDDYEIFGVDFENPLIDKPMRCKNKCIFCFMDQLPCNVRSTMLFKDDDVRLSFLQGNYVTLTNLTDDDIERLCKLKVSPINVSVHVTDGERRVLMLSNPKAKNLLSIMKKFASSGIIMNAQIVLCPGVNDGDYLKKSIEDLRDLYPNINSVSIVPVGITKHREGLYNLKSHTKETSLETINLVKEYQEKFKSEIGTSLVYLADEFYINANVDIPPYEHYEDFPQIENGVGLISSLREEINDELNYLDEYEDKTYSPKTIITSYLAYDFINECVYKVKEKCPELNVKVLKVKNNFFGEKITVTGLICGSDIINQFKGKITTPYLVLSESMFKSDEDIFLDDVTLKDVEDALGVKIIKASNTGYGFIKSLVL